MNLSFDYYTDLLDKILRKEFSLYKKIPEDLDIQLDGPNIIFKTDIIEFKLSSMIFKRNSDHSKYKNLITTWAGLLVFDIKKMRFMSIKEIKKLAKELFTPIMEDLLKKTNYLRKEPK